MRLGGRGKGKVGALSQSLEALPRYAELLRSQYWVDAKLEGRIAAKLQETLGAASKIPFYAAHFGGASVVQDFTKLPILRRSDIPQLNQSVRGMFPAARHFTADCSSGSTGMPMEFLFDASHQHGRVAARARYLRQNGWTPLRRTAWVFLLNFGVDDSADSEFVRSRLFTMTNRIAPPARYRDLFAWLRQIEPSFLYIFPSYLEEVLPAFEQSGARLTNLRRVFTGAEVLDDGLRRRTEQVLGVEISDNYGSTEAFLAWQCPEGRYHVNAEHVLIEIVDQSGAPVASGEMGRVLVTTLENRLMPLVRYEIGDYAVATDDKCVCGRTLPLIERVVGRGLSLFRLRDGSLVSPWPMVGPVKSRREITQFQVVQNSVDHFTVRYVAEQPLRREAEAEITSAFSSILGNVVALNFQRVTEIPRTAAGKYMTALSEL